MSPVVPRGLGCVSPAAMRRAGVWLVAGAAGAAEAGVVLVSTELGLHYQAAVGEVRLVHTVSAQVHNVIHSCAGAAPQHFHLRAGTDRAAAAVGAACVGSLVSQLNVAYGQASILGEVDVAAICPHWDSIS